MKTWDMGWQRLRMRAISPVIATVLMIGLVVVAGLGVALVIFGTTTIPAPIGVEVIGISGFETTDNNIFVDKFSVTLENTESSIVLIQKTDAFEVRNQARTIVPGWGLNLTQDQIPLRPLQTIDLPIALDRNIPGATELVPENDTIFIYLTVYPEGSKFTAREAQIFQSDLLAVEDTFGPVYLTAQTTSSEFDASGVNLSLNIVNNGSTDLDLLLEFSTNSPLEIFFTIDGLNASLQTLPLELPKYRNTLLPGINIAVHAVPASATPSTVYQVFIKIKDQNGIKLWDLVRLFVTYQP
jgi:hypothetical protein